MSNSKTKNAHNHGISMFETLESRLLLTSTTVAYWRFENGTANAAASSATGTILDSSGNGHNGTAFNGPAYSSTVPTSLIPQTAAPDKLSMSFNGSNQRIFIPNSTQFQLTSSLTLEAWVNVKQLPNDYTSEGQIVFRGDDRAGFDPYDLEVRGSNLAFIIEDASGNSTMVTAPLPGLNQWVFVAGTLDGSMGKMDLYVNGQLKTQTTTTVRPLGALTGSNPGLGIGNVESATYSEFFNGLIDEVRISNVALTASQLLYAKDVYAPGSISGNVYHDFNGNGRVNPGDVGLATWTVFLDTNNNNTIDPGEISTVTDAKGGYKFTNLTAGVTYHVREKINLGWLATAPITGVQNAEVPSGTNVTGINFGDARPVTVSGTVFADTNGDGVLDNGETGVAGWKVFIDLNSNGIQDVGENPITTTASGTFTFTGLRPGTFGIELISPTGYVLTTPIEYIATAVSGLTETGFNFGVQKIA